MSMLEEMFEGGKRQELNERPYSRTQSAIDSAKGKVKGAFGSGQIEQGAAEVGAEANKLWVEFKRYIGRKYGKAQQAVPYADVAAFFKGNKLDPQFLGANTRRSFSPKDVGQALLSAVRAYMDEYQDQGEQEQPQPQPQPQGQPAQGGNEQGQGQPQPQPQGGNDAGGLSQVLSSLSTAEREQLLRLLS